MTQYKVTDTELSSIANAIRTKGGTSAPLVFPSGFVSAVVDLPAGANLGSISISQNGTYTPTGSVDGFDNVVVNVEGGITPSGSISISQNGTYDVSSFANAVVSVPQEGGSDDNFLIAIGASTGSIYDTQVSEIVSYAFFRNSVIIGVEMTSVISIWSYAFSNCGSLGVASFPKCTSIGNSAFALCKALSAISFPECTNIGGNVFSGCSSLSTANFPKCTNIGQSAFANCSGLSTISFPECTSIGDNAFYSCSSLSTANFPKCTNIGQSAFFGCSSLLTANFPKCTNIGQSAFFGCRYLSSVYLLSESVTTLTNSKTFYQTPISVSSYLGVFGSVYVPASLVDAYKSAQNWSVYSDRITAYIE